MIIIIDDFIYSKNDLIQLAVVKHGLGLYDFHYKEKIHGALPEKIYLLR